MLCRGSAERELGKLYMGHEFSHPNKRRQRSRTQPATSTYDNKPMIVLLTVEMHDRVKCGTSLVHYRMSDAPRHDNEVVPPPLPDATEPQKHLFELQSATAPSTTIAEADVLRLLKDNNYTTPDATVGLSLQQLPFTEDDRDIFVMGVITSDPNRLISSLDPPTRDSGTGTMFGAANSQQDMVVKTALPVRYQVCVTPPASLSATAGSDRNFGKYANTPTMAGGVQLQNPAWEAKIVERFQQPIAPQQHADYQPAQHTTRKRNGSAQRRSNSRKEETVAKYQARQRAGTTAPAPSRADSDSNWRQGAGTQAGAPEPNAATGASASVTTPTPVEAPPTPMDTTPAPDKST